MNIEEIKTSLDTYKWGSFLFYLGYGLLCIFIFKTYCRNVYFRGNYPHNPKWHGAESGKPRWTEFHDKDGPMDYMTRGAGECCIVMAYSVFFAIRWIFAIMDIAEGASPCDYLNIGYEFLMVQIFTWIMWTFTEIYYTYKQVEWGVIGPVHVILCLIVLSFSITAHVRYDEWTKTVNCQINNTI